MNPIKDTVHEEFVALVVDKVSKLRFGDVFDDETSIRLEIEF